MSQSSSYVSRTYAPKRNLVLNRLQESMESQPYTLFKVKPLGPVMGAEVEGIDLSKTIGPEMKKELHRAFREWKVLFFRNQLMTSEQQIAFAHLWGQLEIEFRLSEIERSERVLK